VTDAETRLQQSRDLEISKMPDGYVIYRPSSDGVVFLNMTAAVILELCDGNLTLGDIRSILNEAYDLEAFPQAEFDACVKTLLDQGLVVPCTT
jgi:hypothetical protein